MNKPTLFTFSEARNIEELEWLLRLRYRIFQETHPGFYPLSIKRIFKHTKRANKMKQIAGLYAFREIKDEVGLLAAFRLRYQTYFQQPHLRQLITVNTAEVDIDGYDVYSRHYGLYKINGQSEEMIGYLRVIVTESTVAIFFYDSNHQNAIISHSEAHERLYQSCFFTPCSDLKRNQFTGASEPRCISLLLQQNVKAILPEVVKEKWQRMAEEYKTTGRIEYVKRAVVLA